MEGFPSYVVDLEPNIRRVASSTKRNPEGTTRERSFVGWFGPALRARGRRRFEEAMLASTPRLGSIFERNLGLRRTRRSDGSDGFLERRNPTFRRRSFLRTAFPTGFLSQRRLLREETEIFRQGHASKTRRTFAFPTLRQEHSTSGRRRIDHRPSRREGWTEERPFVDRREGASPDGVSGWVGTCGSQIHSFESSSNQRRT